MHVYDRDRIWHFMCRAFPSSGQVPTPEPTHAVSLVLCVHRGSACMSLFLCMCMCVCLHELFCIESLFVCVCARDSVCLNASM